MVGKGNRNLQPWLDYFSALQTFEMGGYLEVDAGKGEAYVTLPALYVLSGDGSPSSIVATARRLRAYAGWKSQQGKDFLQRPFSLHAVDDKAPHDLLYTLLLSRRRVWWKLWMKADCVDVFAYGREKQEG